jgi:hypothetical protein
VVDRKEDVFKFWNPKHATSFNIQSRTVIFAKVMYSDFCKNDKLQIAHQIAAVHGELDELYASDSDTNTVDDGNNIPSSEHHPPDDAHNNVDHDKESLQ